MATKSVPRQKPAPEASADEHDLDRQPLEGHLSDSPVTRRRLGLLLVIGGVLGFISAFTITIEKIKLLEDPSYQPSCSINPIISCGSVMASWQASLFHFPNPLIGIGAFAIAITLGALLLSGVTLPRWMSVGFQVGITLGVVFIGWLVSQSLYSIHALCPYCMVVWAMVIPMFWTTTFDNLDRGVIPVPAGARRAVATLVEYRILFTVASYALVVLLIGIQFWNYWSTLL
jgi:uncharacterized membrane protein